MAYRRTETREKKWRAIWEGPLGETNRKKHRHRDGKQKYDFVEPLELYKELKLVINFYGGNMRMESGQRPVVPQRSGCAERENTPFGRYVASGMHHRFTVAICANVFYSKRRIRRYDFLLCDIFSFFSFAQSKQNVNQRKFTPMSKQTL